MRTPAIVALFSFTIRVVIGLLLGSVTWWCYLNGARFAGVPRLVYYVLDWPVATVGLLLPAYWAGIDAFYGRNLCDFCTAPELLVEHLKLAVPVFVGLSYAVTALHVRWRRRSKITVEDPAEDGSFVDTRGE
jgi:hypothetical protein